MNLEITLIIGLIAALLMFTGDMIMYYHPDDYDTDGTHKPIIELMKKIPDRRLYIGGLIGPIAAFLYCVGYTHIFFVGEGKGCLLLSISFVTYCLSIIMGGAYHTHCSNLGLIGKTGNEEAVEKVSKYLSYQSMILYGFQVVSLLLLLICVAVGWTSFPRWTALLTPGVLYLLLPLVRKLPKPFHMVIAGGWTNLIFVIYYITAILLTI
jgi:hypothetical protein